MAKSGTCEAIRARMVFPVQRILAEEGLERRRATRRVYLNGLRIQGLSTHPQSVEAAEAEGSKLLEDCQRYIRKEDVPAFLGLLGMYPGLIVHRWVRETLHTLAREGALHRDPGHPTGCYQIYPLVVVVLVEQLLSKKEEPNRERAFIKLEALGVMSYASAKDSFYRALREKRFRAILLTSPELARVSAEELADRVRKAETLQPGGPITRTVEDPRLGSMSITLGMK